MKVIFTKGLLVGNVADFSEKLIRIGRGEENELCLMTDGVSRRHAQIRRDDDGRWKLSDLGSTNGIKVNGVRISGEVEIREGDDIEIGEQCMRIDLSDEESGSGGSRFADEPAEVKITVPIPEPFLAPPDELADAGFTGAETRMIPDGLASPPEENSGETPSLFAENDPETAAKEKKTEPAPAPLRERLPRIVRSIIFYVSLAIIVIGVISFCMKKFSAHGSPAAAPGEAPRQEGDFVFRYERTIFSRDNVFRFALTVEKDSAEMTLDDIRHHRSLRRSVGEPRGVQLFREAVRASGIARMNPPPEPRERQSVRRRITLVADGKISEFRIDGETVPQEVRKIEDAVDDFAENHGLKTISLTPEQLRELAAESFSKAEDLYENREANYSNLREAIHRYSQTVTYLEQFSPRPALWARASKRLAEATELRKQRFKELNFELIRQEKLGNRAMTRQTLKQIMDLVDSDSRQYDQARRKLFLLDNSGRRSR